MDASLTAPDPVAHTDNPPAYPQHFYAGELARIPSASSLPDPPPITCSVIGLLKNRPSHSSDGFFHHREVQVWRDQLELKIVSLLFLSNYILY
jgi:hypothetical protein